MVAVILVAVAGDNMASGAEKPTIFISYSHKDEPDPAFYPNAIRWLTFVTSHLGPAQAHGELNLWDDRVIEGGSDWKKQIDEALSRCAVCILLVSRHSLTSRFILDVEMQEILERHHVRGAHLYPIVITSCDMTPAKWLMNLNLRPRDGTALELYPEPQRNAAMAALAGEIRSLVDSFKCAPTTQVNSPTQSIDIARLPETAYKRLVGRDDELEFLDNAWAKPAVNVLSLVAWGGAGKTTLVNEWLTRLQFESYRGAEAVLGWSFYDQGTKERATSADLFLEWALTSLGVADLPTDANLRGELLSKTIKGRRILLVLDGVEPLQYGPGPQEGLLKDVGLRSFLRRFAAEPPSSTLSLVVLTSRLRLKDLNKESSQFGSAPVLELDRLSDEAGAELLADNDVSGTTEDLQEAVREFGGHALALSLLGGFLVRRHGGNIQRRDSIGPLLVAGGRTIDEFVHGHAKRVMRSIESEWLKDQPVLQAVMDMVSLFDRPARAELLNELKSEFVLKGSGNTNQHVSEDEWLDAVSDLRAVRLLAPVDRSAPDDLDTHPLIRDWFSSQMEARNLNGWRIAHRRLYEFLKKNTDEGSKPTLASLQPLYQAISHGCKAGLYEDALYNIYYSRIARREADKPGFHYSTQMLGSSSTDLATLSQFFVIPFERATERLSDDAKNDLISNTSAMLGNLGRLTEATRALSSLMQQLKKQKLNARGYSNGAFVSGNLASNLIGLGNLTDALAAARTAITFANKSVKFFGSFAIAYTNLASVYFAVGKIENARDLLQQIEAKQRPDDADVGPIGIAHLVTKADILIYDGKWEEAKHVTEKLISGASHILFHEGSGLLFQARAGFGLLLEKALTGAHQNIPAEISREEVKALEDRFNEALAVLRNAEHHVFLARGYICRAAFRIAQGNWNSATADLDEAQEIAVTGSMKLLQTDIAIHRARMVLGKRYHFSPLSLTPQRPFDQLDISESCLDDEASKQLEFAANLIEKTGYNLRAAEVSDLRRACGNPELVTQLPVRV